MLGDADVPSAVVVQFESTFGVASALLDAKLDFYAKSRWYAYLRGNAKSHKLAQRQMGDYSLTNLRNVWPWRVVGNESNIHPSQPCYKRELRVCKSLSPAFGGLQHLREYKESKRNYDRGTPITTSPARGAVNYIATRPSSGEFIARSVCP
jgi:hypothetical protein